MDSSSGPPERLRCEHTCHASIDEAELRGLCIAIQGRLGELSSNAALATSTLEELRRTALNRISCDASTSDHSTSCDGSMAAIELRCAELSHAISRAEASKRLELETELVAADEELERLLRQDPGDMVALRATLCDKFGPPPLSPKEPASFLLIPTGEKDIAMLRNSSRIDAAAFAVSAPPDVAFAVTGVPFTLEVSTSTSCDDAAITELAATLAEQLRVIAFLVPSLASPIIMPVPLTSVVEIARRDAVEIPPLSASDGFFSENARRRRAFFQTRHVMAHEVVLARVAISLPQAPLSLLPGSDGCNQWVLRVGKVSLGGVPLQMGKLASRAFPVVVRPLPGPVRPAGPLHAACMRGDLVTSRRIVSPWLLHAWLPDDYSTEETDEVRGKRWGSYVLWVRNHGTVYARPCRRATAGWIHLPSSCAVIS